MQKKQADLSAELREKDSELEDLGCWRALLAKVNEVLLIILHFMNYISSERETNKTADRSQEESLVKDEEEVFHKRYTKRIK